MIPRPAGVGAGLHVRQKRTFAATVKKDSVSRRTLVDKADGASRGGGLGRKGCLLMTTRRHDDESQSDEDRESDDAQF